MGDDEQGARPLAGERPTGPPVAAVLVAAAVGGGAVMGVELAAVRLIAPWFGSSLTVWTNVLGTVLAALSLGYLLGGRLAAGPRPAVRLGQALVVAALLTATLPWLADSVATQFLPETLALGAASEVLTWGSLATSLTLYLPPAVLLGTVGPLAVESIQRRRGGPAGAAGGLVLCVSTLGSLVGTFATTHSALPLLGLTGTFAAASAALGIAGVLLLAASGARGFAAAGALLGLVGVGATAVAGPDARGAIGSVDGDGRRLLDLAESRYQRVRVVELGASDKPSTDGAATTAEPRLRRLEVNERSDSFQSVWQPEPGLLPYGFYYNDFALPVWWSRAESGGPDQWRVLILGLGAGTAWRVIDGSAPATTAVTGAGIELDATVVALAREHLDLPGHGERLAVHAGLDARAGLRVLDGRFDQVVLDTYANQVEVPPHLGSVEFFGEVAARLVDGGWLTVNVGAFGLDDPMVEALGATVAAAFGQEVLALQVPGARNVTLIARNGQAPPATIDPEAIADESVAGLLWSRTVPGMTRRITADSAVLTDDHSPLLALQRRSLRAAAERELPTAADGRTAIAALERERADAAGGTTGVTALEASRAYESAGALRQAYGAALAGLEDDPATLELHLRCGAVALSMGAPERARVHLDDLGRGLEEASLDPAARSWWDDRHRENLAWCDAADADERARGQARDRGRFRSFALLGLVGVTGLVAAARTAFGARS